MLNMYFYLKLLFYSFLYILVKTNDVDISRKKTISKLKENIKKIEIGNWKIENISNPNIENINEIYSEFIKEKTNPNFNIESRIILRSSYEFNKEVNNFDFFYSKSMAKNDNGIFVNILLITIQNNNISFFDLDSNLMKSFILPYEIYNFITMKIQDEVEIFIISKNKTNLFKYRLKIRKDIGDNYNKTENILVKSYIDEFSQVPHNVYNLSYSYLNSIKKLRFNLTLKKKFFQFNNSNEEIISTQTIMMKGLKYIIIYSNLGNIYKLKTWDMLIEKKQNIKIENTTIPFLYYTFAFFLNKEKDSLSIYHIHNTSNLLSKCIFKNEKEEIINMFYDGLLRILIVATTNSKLYFAFPSLYINMKQDCFYEYFTDISINVKRGIFIEISRRVLYLSNKEKEMEIIDLNDLDFHKISFLNNKIRKRKIEIGEDKKEFLIKEPKFIKTGNEQYMIMQDNKNKLLLYYIPNVNSKIKGNEEISFNFKIPIIIVALVIIFFVNYIKKKNEKDEFEKRKLKNQVIEEIKKYGGSGKKFKED